MKFNISKAERTRKLTAVALTLVNGMNVIVGNKIIDKVLEADGLNFSFFRAICAAGGYALSFEGSMVQHKAGDNYGDGAEYLSDGYHINSPEDSYPEIVPTPVYFTLKIQLPEYVKADSLSGNTAVVAKTMPNQGAKAFGDDVGQEQGNDESKEEVKEEAVDVKTGEITETKAEAGDDNA